jgi:hypothetical protein
MNPTKHRTGLSNRQSFAYQPRLLDNGLLGLFHSLRTNSFETPRLFHAFEPKNGQYRPPPLTVFNDFIILKRAYLGSSKALRKIILTTYFLQKQGKLSLLWLAIEIVSDFYFS